MVCMWGGGGGGGGGGGEGGGGGTNRQGTNDIQTYKTKDTHLHDGFFLFPRNSRCLEAIYMKVQDY